MTEHNDWNPTFRTPDGEELETSDWAEWRNGPQHPNGDVDRWVHVSCRASTRRKLSGAKLDGESYDQAILQLVALADREAADE